MGQQNSAKMVWTGEGLDFQGSVGSGYHFDVSAGSEKTGGGPMEFMLASVAGCTAADIVSMLQKQRQDISGIEVEIKGTRAEDHPRVYTDVILHYLVRGKDVDPNAVERAIRLSKEKYCSASAMVARSGANVQTSFTIEEDSGEA